MVGFLKQPGFFESCLHPSDLHYYWVVLQSADNADNPDTDNEVTGNSDQYQNADKSDNADTCNSWWVLLFDKQWAIQAHNQTFARGGSSAEGTSRVEAPTGRGIPSPAD